MLTLHISEADIERLSYERYTYPCPLIQKRLFSLYLKSQGVYNHGQIADIVGVCADSVTNYIKCYNAGGLRAVYANNYGTNQSELENHSESLLSYFEEHPPHTINQAIAVIKELTDIERSPTQVKKWFKSHGLKYRKCGQIPAKAKPEVQKAFVEQTLNPLIQKAENEEIHLLFMDAAHFVMGVFLCFLWSVKRVFVKSSPGRKRYNVLGAVNAINQHIHTYTNTDYINAESIVEFLHQLRIYYYDMKPIYIVVDNARYQKCQLVFYVAWQFNIHMVYLPGYSPNLNIIERLWKWVKKNALYATYYSDFEQFKDAIDKTIKKANQEAKAEIKTLLSLKFQMF